MNRSYVRNGLNRYASVDGVAFTYDGRGNLTSDAARSFAYDLENRLTAATDGGSAMSLAYDPLGRLRQTSVGSATTQFLYDGDRLVAEYDAAGTLLRRYVHGAGVDEPVVWYEGSGLTDARHLLTDERGSIVAVSGASTTRLAYGPYGEPGDWPGPRFRYTGQIALPEVRLYHYKARAYVPGLGRFLQTDPVGYEDDLNLYGYVANDPVNRTDPTGMQARVSMYMYDVAAASDGPGPNHALVEIDDLRTGQVHILRGGPSEKDLGSFIASALTGNLTIEAETKLDSQSYDAQYIAVKDVARVDSTYLPDANGADLVRSAREYTDRVNEAGAGYGPNRNSNTVASEGYEVLTGRRIIRSDLPGSGSSIASPPVSPHDPLAGCRQVGKC